MATATAASAISLGLNACFAARRVIPSPSVSFLSRKTPSALPLSLSSSAFTSGTRLVLLNRNFTRGAPNRRPLQVECVKCYKMKTHKAISIRESDYEEKSREAAFTQKEECEEETQAVQNG
ncbi:hypothetical protein M569_16205 [Genlisea aurea]|uniref:Uncharacterized protein n=1 Tax=Genlisea aurea TaxID=192259 RepID=S8BW60_9LAMI|nr:hypothetical protein M569_16205 [Genlisea aurea]